MAKGTLLSAPACVCEACPALRPWLWSAAMARSSASRKSQQSAAVFDFVQFFVRRRLDWRVGTRGAVLARNTPGGVITVVHRSSVATAVDVVEHNIAQLRPEAGAFRLFWKQANGRWTAYCDRSGKCVIGSLAACLAEISRDPFGCYWS